MIFVFFSFRGEQTLFCSLYISLSAKCFVFVTGSFVLNVSQSALPPHFCVHGRTLLLQIDLGLTQSECVVFHCT